MAGGLRSPRLRARGRSRAVPQRRALTARPAFCARGAERCGTALRLCRAHSAPCRLERAAPAWGSEFLTEVFSNFVVNAPFWNAARAILFLMRFSSFLLCFPFQSLCDVPLPLFPLLYFAAVLAAVLSR